MHAFHKPVFQVFSACKTIIHTDFQRTATMQCFTEDKTFLGR